MYSSPLDEIDEVVVFSRAMHAACQATPQLLPMLGLSAEQGGIAAAVPREESLALHAWLAEGVRKGMGGDVHAQQQRSCSWPRGCVWPLRVNGSPTRSVAGVQDRGPARRAPGQGALWPSGPIPQSVTDAKPSSQSSAKSQRWSKCSVALLDRPFVPVAAQFYTNNTLLASNPRDPRKCYASSCSSRSPWLQQ